MLVPRRYPSGQVIELAVGSWIMPMRSLLEPSSICRLRYVTVLCCCMEIQNRRDRGFELFDMLLVRTFFHLYLVRILQEPGLKKSHISTHYGLKHNVDLDIN
jgi:hypothetical protein